MRTLAACSGMFAGAAIGAAATHQPGLMALCVFAAVICWAFSGREKG